MNAARSSTRKQRKRRVWRVKSRPAIEAPISILGAKARPELKHFDTAMLQAAIPTLSSANVIALIAIAVGTATNQRIGRQIQLVDLEYDFFFNPPSGGGNDCVTLMILYDTLANGNSTTVTDIVDTTTVGFPWAPVDVDKFGNRFQILFVRKFVVVSALNAPRFYGHLKLNKSIQYSGATAPTQNLILYVTSNANTGAGATAAQFYGNTRVTYVDA